MNIPDKITGNNYSAAEFTEFKNEIQNAILSTSQTLGVNSVQIKQTLARYASSGASLTENGVANAYNLIAKGVYDVPNTYQDGQVFIFKTANASTGASTLAVSGLPAKTIKKNAFSSALIEGEIEVDRINIVYYDLSEDAFELVNINTNEGLLAKYDMTNAGANDLNEIDITWLTAWDSYDFVNIEIEGCVSGNTGEMAFSLSSDGGTTWPTLVSRSRSAVGWTVSNVQSLFSAGMYMRLNGNKKLPYCTYLNDSETNDLSRGGEGQGTMFDYSGTNLTNQVNISSYVGWDTGSSGLDTYMLRFLHEVGNFTAGTLKVYGGKF